jgi:hypothetical protein
VLDFEKNIALLVAILAIFSGLLYPILNFDLACATSEGGGDTNDGGDNNDGGGDSEGGGTELK